MHFATHSPDSSLPGDVQKCRHEASSNSFTPPMCCHKNGNDFHHLAAKLRTPWVGGIGVAAEAALVFRDQYNSQITCIHNALEDTARIADCSLSPNLEEELLGQLAKLIHVGGCRCADKI